MKTLILLLSVLFTTMSFAQVPNYVPANGLVGWWPFNGNANDESGNGNNGTVNGATLTIDRNGVANQAYSFDGDDRIDVGNLNLGQIQYSYTYSTWFRTSSTSNTDKTIISDYNSSSGDDDIFSCWNLLEFNNQVVRFETRNYPNGYGVGSTSPLNNGFWHNMVSVLDRNTGQLELYVDGIFISSTSFPNQTNFDANGFLRFGVHMWSNTFQSSAYWIGEIDDIGIWNRALTDCEIQNLYNSSNPTNTTTASACDSYTWNGTTYTSSGTYTGTTANCVTQSLNLTITPSSTNTTPISACNSYTWNGTTYTTSGVYTGTTSNCVTQALNLTINTNTSSSISQTALDSYTWPVNSQTYTTTGAYTAVIPNAAGCDSTITLNLTMSFTGINDLSTSKLSVYPNPTNGDFTITGLELVGTVSSLSLTDMNGKVVKVLDTKATKFSMASIKPGVYFLNIISENKQEVLKIVKE